MTAGATHDGRGRRTRRAAHLELRLGAAVPGVVVRLAPAVLVAVLVAVLGGGPALSVIGAGLASVAVWRPDLPASSMLAVVVGLALLGKPDLLAADHVGALAALVLGLHLMAVVTALAAHVGWRGRVEVRVLRRALGQVLRVQVPVQGLVLVTWALHSGAPAPGWVRYVAVLAVAAAALLLLPLVRRAVRG